MNRTSRVSVAGDRAAFLTVFIALALGSLTPVAPAQTLPTLDLKFSPVLTRLGGYVSAAAVQTDGKIVVAGAFNGINGVARNGMARLNADGTVDTSFTVLSVCCGTGTGPTDLKAPVSAMRLQGDGKVLIGGYFTNVNGVARSGLARLNTDGSLDTTFDPGTGLSIGAGAQRYPPVFKLIVQPDGKILVGGYYVSINGVVRNGIARLNANGSVDTSFDPGSGLAINDPTDAGLLTGMELLPSGQVLLSGEIQSVNAILVDGVARLNANGSLDTAFTPDIRLVTGPAAVESMVLQSNGSIVITGTFDEIDFQDSSGFSRLTPDGKLDTTFNPNVDSSISESFKLLTVTTGDKMIAYHEFTDSSGTTHHTVARLNADGSLDSSLTPLELQPGEGGQLKLGGVLFQPDGKLLVYGNLSAAQNGAHEGIARLDAAGNLDASLNPVFELAEGTAANVLTLAVQPDDKVVVGGSFNRINGVAQPYLARFNSDGTVDRSFKPVIDTSDPRNWVSAITVQTNGYILIGGLFTSVNGTNRNGIARLNLDGTLDNSFDVGTGTGGTGKVTAFGQQPDGQLLVAGDFSQLNGIQISSLARLGTNGTVDQTFNTEFPACADCTTPEIHSIGVLTNGIIMIGGQFNRVEAFTMNGVARLQTNGSADIHFVPPIQANETVSSLVVGSDSKTTAAISSADATGAGSQTRFLRFNPDGSVDASFTPVLVTSKTSIATPVSAMAMDAAGRIVVAGQFDTVGGVTRQGLARLTPDGTLDTTFDAGAGIASAVLQVTQGALPLVTTVGLQSNGGIVVGGNFALVNNQVRLGLARYQADQATGGGGNGGGTGGGGGNGGGGTGSGLTLSAPVRASDGSFSFMVTGTSGVSYTVESSTDLKTWTQAGTVTGTGSPAQFTDKSSQGVPVRFYRVRGP